MTDARPQPTSIPAPAEPDAQVARGPQPQSERIVQDGETKSVQYRLPLEGRAPPQPLGRPATEGEQDPAARVEDAGDLQRGPSVWEARPAKS